MKTLLIATTLLLLSACASKPTHNHAMIEKYPHCYHQNIKISNKCIAENEKGNNVTAVELENKAYPGQYN
ncbi:MAG: hypothetical protein KDD61_04375 [Bdellovibrionales bacterium]|nr:hypothetical protein [Bdellovibrionales bacterium]